MAAFQGDFEKIVKLISDGEASLYDCDEEGNTLLHVSPIQEIHTKKTLYLIGF